MRSAGVFFERSCLLAHARLPSAHRDVRLLLWYQTLMLRKEETMDVFDSSSHVGSN